MSPYDAGWRFSGGSRIQRPNRVERCPQCGEPVGTTYPDCPVCYHVVEDIWLADWNALLHMEQIEPGSPDEVLLAQVVMEETERHP